MNTNPHPSRKRSVPQSRSQRRLMIQFQSNLHRRMFRNPKPPSRKMPLPKRNQLKWIRQFRSRMPQFRRKPCLKSPRRRSRCQIKMLLQRSHLRVRLKRTRFRKRSP